MIGQTDRGWMAVCGAIAIALAVQTVRLSEIGARLRAEQAKPYWPDQPEPLGLEEASAPRFKPSTRSTIPEAFWGEFAEDVHDCGGESSSLITASRITVSDTDRQEVANVRWISPQRIELETSGGGLGGASFAMELSDDRDEILFIYTNMKRVYQRCSKRAHSEPEPLRVAPTSVSEDMMAIDANMTLDANEASWADE